MQLTKVLIATALGVSLLGTAAAAEQQVIAGAGPSTKVVELFFDNFARQPAAQGYTFVVPPISTKHAGGIASTQKELFGRTGRPLNDAERARGVEEIFLARVPIALAVGTNNPVTNLSLSDIEAIFTGKIGNWKELGGPDAQIVTVGREPSEALFTELKEQFPFFKEACFDVVLKKDHDVVSFLHSPAGNLAIAFGAEPNFADLKILEVKEGFEAGVRLGLVYATANAGHPLVAAVKSYANSPEWRKLVRRAQMLPAR